jgi:glycosyltransferase involved in cell wall biosynthesis
MEEWSLYLLAKGYEVVTLASRPAGVENDPPNKALRAVHWSPWLEKIRIRQTHAFFFTVLENLPSLEPNVVHSCYFYDSLAASLLKKKRGFRTILQMNGVLVPGVSCYRYWPPEARLIKEAIHRADVRIVCSGFVRDMVREHYGAESHVILPPLNWARWSGPDVPRADPPVVLGIADFTQHRKGIRVLLQAFAKLKAEMPDVQLWLSGYFSKELEAELLDPLPAALRSAIQVFGVGGVDDVPRLYKQASVTVLPSMWEPSGTVMMESWASGTPVVATRHGGLPEYFADGTGFLFDPQTNEQEARNPQGLAEALCQALALARAEGIRERCRKHAWQFSAEMLGPQIESLYRTC